ncbi:MAG: oligosaccharide flippase family protein [bacterium]|nr:oligosaccharide flippase family protein [bacterium]
MFQKIKALAGQSVIYGIGQVATRAASFLLLPAYTYWLPVADYGALTLYYSFIAVAQVIYLYGIDVSLMRYYIPLKEKTQRNELFSTVLVLSFFSSTLISALLWLLRAPLASSILEEGAAPVILLFCLVVLWLDTFSALPFVVLRAKQKAFHYTSLRMLSVLLNLGANFWLVGHLHRGLQGVLEANILSSAITMIPLLWIIRKDISFKFNWKILPPVLKFGLPNIPHLFFVMVLELSSRKFLEYYSSAEQTGLYGVGAKLGMIFSILAMAFRNAWAPFFLEEGEKPDSPNLFARVLTYFLLVFGILFLFLTYYIPPIMKMPIPGFSMPLIEPKYWGGIEIFPIILLGQVFNGVAANLSAGFFLRNRIHIQAYISGVASAASVLFNIWLIPVSVFGQRRGASLSGMAVLPSASGYMPEKIIRYPMRGNDCSI